MDIDGDMGLNVIGGDFEPGLVVRMGEDDYESRSGSDNVELGSGDDQDAAAENGPGAKKKKYHRHTASQIQELEALFKEYPHPDENQRAELGRMLGLEVKQIKFWFQNRRTQMKAQLERHENVILRQENEKLRAENDLLKQAMANPICNTCGEPAVPADASPDRNQLRIENVRLRQELSRLCSLTNKVLGKHRSWSSSSSVNPSAPPPTTTQGLNSNPELAVGSNGFGGGFNFGDGLMMPRMKHTVSEAVYDKSAAVDVAFSAMDEFMKLVHLGNPLWIQGFDGVLEVLNIEEYTRTFPPCIGAKPSSFATEATRATGLVFLRGSALVEALMNADRWVEMFPCFISKATTIDVLSNGGTGVTGANELQVMNAEFLVLSPLVPVRQVKFIRYCKQHSEGVWAVVDVSIDANKKNRSTMLPNYRRLPSGCIIQQVDDKCCKVLWVEHSEYDESGVHQTLRPLLSSGLGFGGHRWLAALERHSDCMEILMSEDIPSGSNITGVTSNGKKILLKLAQRMMYGFCSGVCASSYYEWQKVTIDGVSEDVKVMTRKSINDPGEPQGVVMSATISLWMPVKQQQLFDYLRDVQRRSEWDILSHGGVMEEMIHAAKGMRSGNRVSLLRGCADNGSENGMLILQETWSDASGAVVVYAPVDVASIGLAMNGGDPACVSILPSGFSILPAIPPNYHGGTSDSNGPPLDGSISNGCLLTLGFQILMNKTPTSKLTTESVVTVNNLITHTIEKIRAAFSTMPIA